MNRESLLRPVLLFDAATCGVMGLMLLLAAAPLAGFTDLPAALLREAGILLLPFALFALWASRRAGGWPVQVVVAANIAWVGGSLALLAGPWVAPNMLGTVFVDAQAAAVAGLAALQLYGLSRQPATA